MAKKYKIPVFWQMMGEIEVEAENYEEAMMLAESEPLPEGDYVGGSFEVNRECVEALYGEEARDEGV